MSLVVCGNTNETMLLSCAPHEMNGATPPATRSGLSCVELPPTITSKCGDEPGSVVTTSIVNGANVSFTHCTSWFQLAVPCGYAGNTTVETGMLERFVIELSVPGY